MHILFSMSDKVSRRRQLVFGHTHPLNRISILRHFFLSGSASIWPLLIQRSPDPCYRADNNSILMSLEGRAERIFIANKVISIYAIEENCRKD